MKKNYSPSDMLTGKPRMDAIDSLPSFSVLDFAYEIIDMHNLLIAKETEINHLMWYKDAYNEMLESTNKHNGIMLGGLFGVAMKMSKIEDENTELKAAQKEKEDGAN